jgi:hypothetical protein
LQNWATRYGYDVQQDQYLYNILNQYPDLYKHWLYRYGNTNSKEILNNGLYYSSNLPKTILGDRGKGIVSTTSVRFPYDKFDIENTEHSFKLETFDWDYIIFDEASMIPLTQVVYAIYQQTHNNTKQPQFIIAGDPFQIKPVLDIPDVSDSIPAIIEHKEENIYSMIQLDSFNTQISQHLHPTNQAIQYPVEYLTIQYRSLESIGKLFSKFQYNDILQHHRQGQNPKPLLLKDEQKQIFSLKPITMVRFPVNSFDGIYRPSRVNGSAYHAHTAILVTEFVKRIREEKDNDSLNIGIITPYKTQMALIAKQIEAFNVPNVYVNTVHGFQGDEMDIIIAIFNPPNYSILSPTHEFAKYYHLHKKNLINVAISRAKDYLIMFVPDNSTKDINNLHLFKGAGGIEDIIHNTTEIYPQNFKDCVSRDIEKMLFGQDKYIEQNSIVLAHEFVNVYEKGQVKYTIRSAHNAIDLQISENLPNAN